MCGVTSRKSEEETPPVVYKQKKNKGRTKEKENVKIRQVFVV